jgi:hypothetical protein
MTRVSTTLLTIGPRVLAPWGDRAWRVSATAQMVMGSAPYWIVTPTQPAQHLVAPSEIEVSAPNTESVVESILFMLAAHFGDAEVENFLVESHNISLGPNSARELARFYELVYEGQDFLARVMSERLRIGVVHLDDLSLVNEDVISRLREMGFDVDTFSQSSSAQV